MNIQLRYQRSAVGDWEIIDFQEDEEDAQDAYRGVLAAMEKGAIHRAKLLLIDDEHYVEIREDSRYEDHLT